MTKRRSSAKRSAAVGAEAGGNATQIPYIDQEIVGNDAATNWNSLTAALLAGRSVELIPVVQANRVRMIARTWLDFRADGSNDPRVTVPKPPLAVGRRLRPSYFAMGVLRCNGSNQWSVSQIPPDVVVKSQGIDITRVILVTKQATKRHPNTG